MDRKRSMKRKTRAASASRAKRQPKKKSETREGVSVAASQGVGGPAPLSDIPTPY